MTIILSNLNRFTIFFTGRFLGKFAHKCILKIPPHFALLCCYTTLSAKQAINDKLQGSVATYFRCDGVVNNQIKKGLLLSLRVKMLKSVNIRQSYKQERGCLVHFLRLLAKKNSLSCDTCNFGFIIFQCPLTTMYHLYNVLRGCQTLRSRGFISPILLFPDSQAAVWLRKSCNERKA